MFSVVVVSHRFSVRGFRHEFHFTLGVYLTFRYCLPIMTIMLTLHILYFQPSIWSSKLDWTTIPWHFKLAFPGKFGKLRGMFDSRNVLTLQTLHVKSKSYYHSLNLSTNSLQLFNSFKLTLQPLF